MNDIYIKFVKDNDINNLRQLLKTNINDIDLNYDTNKALLLCCAYSYNYNILKLLIEYGIKIDPYYILVAMNHHNYDVIYLLLDSGVPLSKINSILNFIVNQNKYDILKNIVKYLTTEQIFDVINYAIEKENDKIIFILLRYKKNNIYKNYINHKIFIKVNNHINYLVGIYNTLLLKINDKTYNDINNYIINFIF